MKRLNYKNLTTIIFLLLVVMLGLYQNIDLSYAQADDETLTAPTHLEMIEYSEKIDYNNNISSIDISLPSATWNVSSLQLNFTDIKLGKEVKTIEDKWTDSVKTVWSKGDLGYAVEINITEPTIVFGVYIYGIRSGSPVQPVYVQIQGYDGGLDTPDKNILGSTPINITDQEDWHLQTFEDDIPLSPGKYYLVMNGSALTFPEDKSVYYWYYNDSGSVHTNLHTSKYDGVNWNLETTGEPLLYKLIQRVNRSFNPEEINMTAQINGGSYPILNGAQPGTGFLSINETFAPTSDNFTIPIRNIRADELLFNLNSSVKLQNTFYSIGNVSIQEGLENSWTLTSYSKRWYDNYSIKFYYPDSWDNLIIRRNDLDITLDVTIDTFTKLVSIPNNAIPTDSKWEIIANSPNMAPSLNVPSTEFGPNQEMQFSVLPPIMPGNITFRLINSLGFQVDDDEVIQINEIMGDELILSYNLPSNPNEGIYKAYVFWNSETDAGVQTQEFTITIPFTIDPMLITIIVGAIAFVSVASYTTYKIVKNSKRKHEAHRNAIFNKYMDVLNLEYFIIIHKKSGLNIYEQILASKSIDASLITGFLEAIRTFGIELTGADEQSQTIKLEYHNSKVLMSEFKSFRILLVMKENPSHDFLESIKELSYDIDNKYGSLIENFKGNIDAFSDVKDLLEYHLQTPLIYPLKIIKQDIKLKSDEKSMVNRAKTIMKKKNTDYFIVTNLLSLRKGFDAKDAEIILHLIKKKVFQPKI